ncbi:MAG: putative porin [Bacteroidaceae bacterium]|nr:putative porin [Bacteroidaceae bacterium]
MAICPDIFHLKYGALSRVFALVLLLSVSGAGRSQSTLSQNQDGFNGERMDGFMNMEPSKDSTVVERKVSHDYNQWVIDTGTGLPVAVEPDSLHHLFQYAHLTEGPEGSYSHLGNMGSPRLSRLYFERENVPSFMFDSPFDFWIRQASGFRLTDTKTPLLKLDYYKGGDKRTGEERLKGFFAANFNRKTGIGFDMDYLLGRGRYENQSTSFFDSRLYAYHRDDVYSIYVTVNRDKMKMAENGGILDSRYITNPESMAEGRKQYSPEDIQFRLYSNWNNLDRKQALVNQSLLLSKEIRYLDSIGDTVLYRNRTIEYGKVAHTLEIGRLSRKYMSWSQPDFYYERTFLNNDSVDRASNFYVTNILSFSLLEGFSKWAVAGLSAYVGFEHQNFSMPDTLGGDWDNEYMRRYGENNLFVGGRLERKTGDNLSFSADARTVILGDELGDIEINGDIELSHKLFGEDAGLGANITVSALDPSFFMENFHSTFSWWDNSFEKELRTRIGGWVEIEKTGTRLNVNVESVSNYTYLKNTGIGYDNGNGMDIPTYNITAVQDKGSIQILSAQLRQNLKVGPLHWDNVVTWQLSGDQDVIPLPTLNLFSDLYFKFIYYKRLHMEIGANVTYFTRYYAPSYCPAVGMYHLQSSQCLQEVGGYPLVTGYVNCYLRGARFYVMYYHANDGLFNNTDSFIVPGYPANPGMLKFGLSWPLFD